MDLTDLRNKRIGLALGVGGVRGAAHFGVIRALREKGVNIACVAGASSGAVFGALYAADTMDRAEEFFRRLTWWQSFRMLWEFRLPFGGGLITGKRIEKTLRNLIPYNSFEELKKPLAIVATDLYSGKEVVIKTGDLFHAIKASCAVPGYFQPVLYRGRWLVDGGMVNPLPVSICRDMGAEIVIGVDVNRGRFAGHLRPQRKSPSFAQVFVQTCRIIENEWTRFIVQQNAPDILIQPSVGHILSSQMKQVQHAIKAGELAANKFIAGLATS